MKEKTKRKIKAVLRSPVWLIAFPLEALSAIVVTLLMLVLTLTDLLPDKSWYRGGAYRDEEERASQGRD